MSETWLRAIILVCTFGAVVLAVEAVIRWVADNRAVGRTLNERMRLIGQGRTRGETMNLLRRRPAGVDPSLPPILAGLALRVERMATAARVRAPLNRILMALIALPFGIFLLLVMMMLVSQTSLSFGRLFLIGTFAAILGLALPLMVLSSRANRTRKKMQEQFPVALDVFVRGLRAGHPVAAALDLLTVEMRDPIGSEFGLVVDEVTYGADLRDALQSMAERWDMDELRMFVVSLSVQAETGGNLAEILENLAKVIRERASMMMKVRALSSEGRMTAIMLSALPLLALGVLFMFNPGFYLDVADDPAFVPGFGGLILLYIIGFYTIRRMVDLKV